MLRTIAGYFFGGVQNDQPQETVDCETREVNDWLVVNMADRPAVEVDLDDSMGIDDEEDEILGALSLLMAPDNRGFPEYFPLPNSSDETDSLASSRLDESMTEVISSDERDSISPSNTDEPIMSGVVCLVTRDSISPVRSDDPFLHNSSSHGRDSVSPDKSFLDDDISNDMDSISSSRSEESFLEDDDISDERESSPFSTNCSVIDFHPNEIVESFQNDLLNLNFVSNPFGSIFSDISDIQRGPHNYMLDLLEFEEFGGGMEDLVKEYKHVVKTMEQFRDCRRDVTVIECEPPQMPIPKCIRTSKTILRIIKEKNTKSKTAKNPLLANVTCHPIYSKTYVNHRNPALPPKTDLLDRIKELEPEQEAKELAYKKYISRGQLNRQNKNLIYNSSAKKNRRKDLQRNHSGANNNRKC